MGAGVSCRRDKEPIIETDLQPFDAGSAPSYGQNEIREIKVTDNFSVLVSKCDDKFYAYGSKCPHYGAPLVKGVMVNGKVRCPWHGACFDIKTGDIEDHPGTNNIPTYQVSVSKGGKVTVYPSNFGEYKIQKPLCAGSNRRKSIVILGAGAAGIMCAQTLRENNYDGRILMLTKDGYLPYDRTKLSKSPGITWEEIKLKDEQWFNDAQVEIIINACVIKVDCRKKEIYVKEEEEPVYYDQLLVATGCRPKLPTDSPSGVEGVHYKNVLTLYKLRDAAKIKEKSAGKNVVIMGSGFIAMELASSLPSLCKTVTIISRNKRPYGIVLGETVGRIIQQHVLGKPNVKFIGSDEIKKIIGNDEGVVTKVITLKRKEYACDVLIYAIGGVPNTEMFGEKIDEPYLTFLDSRHIPVTEHMQSNLRDIYAAGDCARVPLDCSVTRWGNVGHWGFAQKTGRIAALNMIGRKETINTTVPFFWHNVAGLSIRYAGYGENYDDNVIFGNLASKKFCVLYRREQKILACCTCNCDPIAAQICFDIQDDIIWDGYPPYITDVFPAPPIIGDTDQGVKYNMEDRIVDWDSSTYYANRQTCSRQAKVYNDDVYEDTNVSDLPKAYVKPKFKIYADGKKHDPKKLATAIFNYPEHQTVIPEDFPADMFRHKQREGVDRRN